MPDTTSVDDSGRRFYDTPGRWFRTISSLAMSILILPGLMASAPVMASQPKGRAELEYRAEAIWGEGNGLLSTATVWVRYEPDLGERSIVDFAKGVASVQILLKADEDPARELVLAHFRQGIANLILNGGKSRAAGMPGEMADTAARKAPLSLPPNKEIRVYLVRPGDSLWKIARQFGMPTDILASLNGLNQGTILPTGTPLKVMALTSHDLTLDSTPTPSVEDPLLLSQIRMADGSLVPPWMVKDFAGEVVRKQPLSRETIIGNDGIERLAATVTFELVSNHLEVRARRFHPMVLAYAEEMSLDPALIMAIIHTESMFNPYARSDAPAYGLMQLVPHTAGKEAYRAVYGSSGRLTSQYLFDPENNIELGAAYFRILKNRYMRGIADPMSRTYCAVAAYNAGASNVGKAFIAKKSIRRAIPAINTLTPDQVYDRLIAALPMRESRDYVRKVLDRISIYRHWQ